MKRRLLQSTVPFLAVCLLLVALTACSAVKRGKVVKKGVDPVGTKLHPGPIHWADVRGPNRKGELVTVRVEFFAWDWQTIRKGQEIEPDRFGFPRFFQRIQAYNEQQRAESGRFGASEQVVAKKKTRPKKRAIAKATPTSTPVPEEAPTTIADASSSVAPAATPEPTATDRARRLMDVREKALDDPAIRQLKANIKTAQTEEEQERAWRDYRSLLRDKMHALDPSLSDLIE